MLGKRALSGETTAAAGISPIVHKRAFSIFAALSIAWLSANLMNPQAIGILGLATASLLIKRSGFRCGLVPREGGILSTYGRLRHRQHQYQRHRRLRRL